MTEAPPRQRTRPERTAAAIALILTSQAPQATKTAEIAQILFEVVRQTATIPVETAAKIAKALAVLAVVRALLERRSERRGQGTQSTTPGLPGITPRSEARPGGSSGSSESRREPLRPQRVEEDELLRRSLYVTRAAQRLALDIAKGRDPMEALEKESRFYLRHTEEQQRRRSAARLRAVAADEFGPVLGWQHAATRIPDQPRDLHERASGYNFRADAGAPAATGGDFPGEKPNCTCAVVAPFPGALTMK